MVKVWALKLDYLSSDPGVNIKANHVTLAKLYTLCIPACSPEKIGIIITTSLILSRLSYFIENSRIMLNI